MFVTNNLNELKDFSHETRWDYIFDILNSHIERKFRTLSIKVNELLGLIKNKKILIRNANDIFEGPNSEYEICNFFNCSDLFVFKINSDSDIDFEYPEKIYTPSYRSSELKFANETISISIEDIITAFNFGVNSIDDIFDIKKEFKDMNNWINSL